MKYSMKILTKEEEYSYIVNTLSAYKWDSILGFDNTPGDLKKVTDEMIKPNFIEEFYRKIIDKEKKYAGFYKDLLLYLIYNIQFDSFLSIPDFKKPDFIYIESYRNDEGDYIKYDYVNKNFNYEYVVKELENKIKKM